MRILSYHHICENNGDHSAQIIETTREHYMPENHTAQVTPERYNLFTY